MAVFSAIVLTAPPPGLAAEAGGAFVKIDGREALLRSVELLLNRDAITQIQVVVAEEAMENAKRRYGPHLSFSGVKLLAGGARWMDQLAAASEHLAGESTHVIVHDGARPAVPSSDIDALLKAAEHHPAVSLAAPVRGVLAEVDEGGNPLAWRLPGDFMALLTPQAFSREKFLEMAHSKVEIHPSQSTLLKGSSLNQRVGGAGDASLIKQMLAMLPKPKLRPPSSPFEEAEW